jgi:hypothetical protein
MASLDEITKETLLLAIFEGQDALVTTGNWRGYPKRGMKKVKRSQVWHLISHCFTKGGNGLSFWTRVL